VKETAVALPGSVVAIEYGAFDAPAGMVTGEGTAAKLGFPLTKETLMPPCGAGPVRKTFPLTVAPPWTNAGALKLESEGGKTVIGWLRVTALPVAEIVLTVLVVTGVVAIVKGFEDSEKDATGKRNHISLRLVAALEAGQAAGGDHRGQESAALIVVKKDCGIWPHNDVVLRLQVDDNPEPIKEMRRLVEKALAPRSGQAPCFRR